MDGHVMPPAEFGNSEEPGGKDVGFFDMCLALATVWLPGGWDGDAGYPLATRVNDFLGCLAQYMRDCG
jgi:hypothetical protein